MPKLKPPREAVRKSPQPKTHVHIEAAFVDDFGRPRALNIVAAKEFTKKKLDAASRALQKRIGRAERQAVRADQREYQAAIRRLKAEERESDLRISRFFRRRIWTKVAPAKKLKHKPPAAPRRTWPYASVALPKYDGPIIDRQGARGVFARFRYYSRKSARAGVSMRVVKYIWTGAALDQDGRPMMRTNVGETIDEALCGFDHLEQINWSAQKNAKLLMHGILAVDYRQTREQMLEVGDRWAERMLGRKGLPYLVTLHEPPPDGDQRNWHLHVVWSWRPFERVADHEWLVSEGLRTDLDSPEGMKHLREGFALAMTEASLEAGTGDIYTALSHAARGLPIEPQIHLGEGRTRGAREGEFIAENEENHECVLRSKAAMIDEELRRTDEEIARRQRSLRFLRTQFARARRLPQVVARYAKPTTLNRVTAPHRPYRLARPFALPAKLPKRRASVTALPPANIPVAKAVAPARVIPEKVGLTTPPMAIGRPTFTKIANLRNRIFAATNPVVVVQPPYEQPRPKLTRIKLLTKKAMRRAARLGIPVLPQRSATTVFGRLTLAKPIHRPGRAVSASPLASAPTALRSPSPIPRVRIVKATKLRTSPVPMSNVGVPAPQAPPVQRAAVTVHRKVREANPELVSPANNGGAPLASAPSIAPKCSPVSSPFAGHLLRPALPTKFEPSVLGQLEERIRDLDLALQSEPKEEAEKDRARSRKSSEEPSNDAAHKLQPDLFALMSERRRLVRRRRNGFTLEPEVLGELGLAADQIDDRRIQASLDRIEFDQRAELASIAAYLGRFPEQLRITEREAELENAPTSVRQLLLAWRGDRTVQQALAEFARATTGERSRNTPRDRARRRALFYRLLPPMLAQEDDRLNQASPVQQRAGAQVRRPNIFDLGFGD